MADTSMVRHTEQPLAFLNSPDGWQRFNDITAIYSAGGADGAGRMMPQCFKTPQQVKAAVLLGMSLGYDLLGALALLQHMHSVEGKIGFGWEWKLARVMQVVPTWRYKIIESTDQKCVAWFQRSPEHERVDLAYTMEQAQKTGLVKDKGAWVQRPAQMLRKTLITQGVSLTAPDAWIGLPKDYQESLEDDEVAAGEPTVLPAGTIAPEVMAASTGSVAVVVETGAGNSPEPSIGGGAKGAPAPVQPTTADENTREVFLAEAERKGWNRKHGPSLYKLLQELLAVDGVVPSWKSAAEIPSGDWRIAYVELCKRYPNGKPKEGGKAEAVRPDAGAAPAQAGAPPPPATSVADLRTDADESADDAQKKDPMFLVQLGQELEKAWKVREGSVVRNIDLEKPGGIWWFTNEAILIELGYVNPDKSAMTMCICGSEQYPARLLKPSQIAQLSEAVASRLREKSQGRSR